MMTDYDALALELRTVHTTHLTWPYFIWNESVWVAVGVL